MPRGLIKATAYYNNLQARDDWRWLAGYAAAHGKGEDAARLAPPADAGYRRIDKAIEALLSALGVAQAFWSFRQDQEEWGGDA